MFRNLRFGRGTYPEKSTLSRPQRQAAGDSPPPINVGIRAAWGGEVPCLNADAGEIFGSLSCGLLIDVQALPFIGGTAASARLGHFGQELLGWPRAICGDVLVAEAELVPVGSVAFGSLWSERDFQAGIDSSPDAGVVEPIDLSALIALLIFPVIDLLDHFVAVGSGSDGFDLGSFIFHFHLALDDDSGLEMNRPANFQ